MWACLNLMALHAVTPNADHAAVRDTIVAGMNGFPADADRLVALLEDDRSAWCDPYPSCTRGKANISTFLHSMPQGTDAVIIAEPMVTQSSVGGMMTTLSFSWPGPASSCLYTADAYVSWNLTSSAAPGGAPKVNYVRWVYNASEFDLAIADCLGPAFKRGGSGGGAAGGREADLQAVKDYVVSLQYSQAKEALICDLLVPTARYCDPYPLSCAFGRAGCRAMKGLPNDTATGTAADLAHAHAVATARPTHTPDGRVASHQSRPASVRPLMPTGPVTGGMYLVYSSATRSALGRVQHKMHHTWAIWDLAPVVQNASRHQQPAGGAQDAMPMPMLASFDWFMPDGDGDRGRLGSL
jgi:hypothetical protein